nr:RNA-dependent RNA polymerase [Luteoviridae sp.]
MREGLRNDAPPPLISDMIQARLRQDFSEALWSIPDDFMQYSHFERVLKKIDMSSSPGYPYLLYCPTNAIFFKVDKEGRIPESRAGEVWQMVQQRLLGDSDPDPIRLFVKPECHSKKKLDEEKYRLISSVSVVDQLCDQMLFSMMNDNLIENWPHIPSKPGWSPYGGGWRHIPEGKWYATDASSWDWTVQPWLVQMVLEARKNLCTNPSELWCELALKRYKELFMNPLFVTSGGMLLRQLKPGVMKSGCVNTIADNSLMQYLLHLRVSYELNIPVTGIYTMGDDRLQEPMERSDEYFSLTSQFCILKHVALKQEFAGFVFGGKLVDPVHKGKHAYNLLHLNEKYEKEIAASYCLLYHRSNYRDWIERMFLSIGIEVPSRAIRDYIYDSSSQSVV